MAISCARPAGCAVTVPLVELEGASQMAADAYKCWFSYCFVTWAPFLCFQCSSSTICCETATGSNSGLGDRSGKRNLPETIFLPSSTAAVISLASEPPWSLGSLGGLKCSSHPGRGQQPGLYATQLHPLRRWKCSGKTYESTDFHHRGFPLC